MLICFLAHVGNAHLHLTSETRRGFGSEVGDWPTSAEDYTKVTEQDMIDLANRQFTVADVPQAAIDEYFRLWNDYKLTLTVK